MRTPANVGDPRVIEFCTTIAPGATAIQVECAPLFGKPLKECFTIVPDHIAANGGAQLIGWAIWQWLGIIIEAEFHVVWQRPDGKLIDITPTNINASAILFLPDPDKKYTGRQVDCIRKPLVIHRDVTRLVFLHWRYAEIINNGDLANKHGEILLIGKAAREAGAIEKEISNLQKRLAKRFAN